MLRIEARSIPTVFCAPAHMLHSNRRAANSALFRLTFFIVQKKRLNRLLLMRRVGLNADYCQVLVKPGMLGRFTGWQMCIHPGSVAIICSRSAARIPSLKCLYAGFCMQTGSVTNSTTKASPVNRILFYQNTAQ